MSSLLAGPWVGEFGWLVAVWAPVVRHRSQKYERTVVVCPETLIYLFEDFANDFIHYEKHGKPDMWKLGKKTIKMPTSIAERDRWDVFSPSKYNMLCRPRKYYRYGNMLPSSRYDLVIHARATRKFGQTNRNWPVENYQAIVDRIAPLTACSIGTDAHHIPGTEDRRNVPIRELCNIMRSSRLMIGPSSGPMHLAQACELPIIVWTYDKKEKAINANNRVRYEHLWKPFNSPVTVIDTEGWQPEVATVIDAVRGYL